MEKKPRWRERQHCWEELCEPTSWFVGPVTELKNTMDALIDEFSLDKEHPGLDLKIEYTDIDGELGVFRKRLETDAEMRRRFAARKKRLEQKKKDAKRDEERELRELTRLKKKYEKKKLNNKS